MSENLIATLAFIGFATLALIGLFAIWFYIVKKIVEIGKRSRLTTDSKKHMPKK